MWVWEVGHERQKRVCTMSRFQRLQWAQRDDESTDWQQKRWVRAAHTQARKRAGGLSIKEGDTEV